MVKIKEVTAFLEKIAPRAYQESYDNAGLLTGNPETEITGMLISLDATEPVIEEAIEKGCNLVVAHHPIIFRGLKSITGKNYVERTVIKAIKNEVAIYASHTNLDSVAQGVNRKICEKLGLRNLKILAPKSNILSKLVTFVPIADTEKVLNALSEAGAGHIGNYKNCSFQTQGIGTFEPNEQANPHIGEKNKLEKVEENRLEVIFPSYLSASILQALRQAHPYEEVAYYLQDVANANQEVGSGMIGELPEPADEQEFLLRIKKDMGLPLVKHTRLLGEKIRRVAVCGGAGSFLLPQALGAKADIFITADYKYHEFFDADGKIIIADIGHYESEIFTKDLIKELLSEKFYTFATYLADTITNPVFYI